MFRWITDAADDDDSQLLVVDPVYSETAEHADGHIAPSPGGDLALARGVLARLIETDRVDTAFVETHTEGFDRVVEALPSVETAAAEAGVTVAAIDRLAAAFERQTLVYWGMGVNQSVRGTKTAGTLIDLCLASGNMGPGSGPFSLTGQANSMGTRVCSSKGTWPGHRPFADPDHRRAVASAWNVPVSRLPDGTGPGPVEMIDDAPSVLWTVATNPVVGMPDTEPVRRRLEETFVIVQDAFETETLAHADVVLPAATWGESAGTAMNMERTVSRVRRATEIPPGVRTDLEIICRIGSRLDANAFGESAPEPAAVFEEFAALTAGTNADCSGIDYDRLEADHAVRWPAPDADTQGGYRYVDPDAERLESRWSFPTPSGRARFSSAPAPTLPESPTAEFPLTLTTGREADGYNTGVRSREVGEEAEPVLARVNPETLAAADCAVNETVAIRTPRARIVARVDADEAVPEGLLWLPIHHPATNRLTHPAVDPKSKEPNFKQCAARLAPPPLNAAGGVDTETGESVVEPPLAGVDPQ
jgi:assimilatory nitrate reductase catalytic subunit